MINKSTIIQELNNAKSAHKRWVKRADHLVSGLPVDETFIPIETEACGFGEWLYGLVGQQLRSEYIFAPTMEQIEFCHDRLHDAYREIHAIYYTQPQTPTLFHKLMKLGRKKVSKRERERAEKHLLALQEHSRELIRLLEKLEKAVKAIDTVLLFRTQQPQGRSAQL